VTLAWPHGHVALGNDGTIFQKSIMHSNSASLAGWRELHAPSAGPGQVADLPSPQQFRHGPTAEFEVLAADSADLLLEAYRIRYQVYCIERVFLDAADYPMQLESDEFDAHSIHILARHKSGTSAGTVRLVLHSEKGFPAQSHCTFDAEFADLGDPASPRVRRYAEISRLAVPRHLGKRFDDTPCAAGSFARRAQGADALVSLEAARSNLVMGLYRYMYHESKRLHITHWIVAMERSLAVILKRMGFPFKQAGPEVDYHGPVRPYVASIAELEHHLARRHPDVLAYMISGLGGRTNTLRAA